MTKQERLNFIIARGEISNHCHVVVGDVSVENKNNNTTLYVGPDGAIIKHVLETDWVDKGELTWTNEHTDIKIAPGTYDYVPQMNYDPIADRLSKVQD